MTTPGAYITFGSLEHLRWLQSQGLFLWLDSTPIEQPEALNWEAIFDEQLAKGETVKGFLQLLDELKNSA